MTAKNRITKFISGLLILLIIMPAVFLSSPKKADAFWGVGDFGISWDGIVGFFTGSTAASSGVSAASNTTSTALKIKDVAKEIGRQVLMAVAKKALQEITKGTVNWINTGFHGSPLFLENPQSFFKDIAKSEVKSLINQFGYDSNRFPFGRDFALNTINSYKSQLDKNASYTLYNALKDDPTKLKNYQTNFNFGGWNGFLINTQYPQNNYIGFQTTVTAELGKQISGAIQTPVERVKDTLQQGMGFLSPQTCLTNPNYNNGINEFNKPTYDMAKFTREHPMDNYPDSDSWMIALLADQKEWGKQYSCTKPDGTSGLANTTPGSVVSNQITSALNIPMNSTLQAMGLGNSLSAVFDALLNHFIDKGLNSLASKSNAQPETDDFTYEGQTLGSPSDNVNNSWDLGPDELVILSTFKQKINGSIIGTCSGIKTSGGASLPDQKNIPEEQCTSLSIPATVIGKCSNIKSSSGSTLSDRTDVSKFQCDSLATTQNTPTWTRNSSGSDLAGGNTVTWTKNPTGSDILPGDLTNAKTELALMDNAYIDPPNNGNPLRPGIIQVLSQIWPNARLLDICLPGPDIGWQDRLQEEMNRNNRKLQNLASNSGGSKGTEAEAVTKELNFAVKSFQDWINNKMMVTLDKAILYMDAVTSIKGLSQQAKELMDKKQTRTQTLARLTAIKTALDDSRFATQPEPGSLEEKLLISLWKQYKAIQNDIPSTVSIEAVKNELATAKEKARNIYYKDPATNIESGLLIDCEKERVDKGWTGNAGPASLLNGVKEQDMFCGLPIKTGYTHATFTGPGTATPSLPMVNSDRVLQYSVTTIKSVLGGILSGSTSKKAYVNIQLNCSTIYTSNPLDYKGDLPGLTEPGLLIRPPAGVPDTIDPNNVPGTCTYTNGDDPNTGFTRIDCDANGGQWTP